MEKKMKKISLIFAIIFAITFLNADEEFSKKGWFAGVGFGITKPTKAQSTPLMSLEVGYGIDENYLVYMAEDVYIVKNSIVSLDSLGLSYYLNEKNYIKASYGVATLIVSGNALPSISFGHGFNIGYGYGISNKSSIEILYNESNIIRIMPNGNIQYELSTVSLEYKYRFF
jgi:hypothetical protein